MPPQRGQRCACGWQCFPGHEYRPQTANLNSLDTMRIIIIYPGGHFRLDMMFYASITASSPTAIVSQLVQSEYTQAMHSSFTFSPDIDDTPESDFNQDDRPGTSSSKPSSNRSRIRVLCSKAKGGFDKIQAKCRMENIPLSLVKQNIQPGQDWIKGAMFCAWGTASIAVLNIILTIIAVGIAYSRKAGDNHFTYAQLYEGNCSLTGNWATGMHLVINALGALLLAASNYVMQCLSAPSRVDVDNAHSNSASLDIGVLSLRNMWIMSAQRKALWSLLLITSLPIHMLCVLPIPPPR